MRLRSTIPFIFIMFFSVTFVLPATAEFYRYKDKHGNVIYTDDLNKIPPEQRNQILPYEESESATPADTEKPAAEEKTSDQNQASSDMNEKERLQLKQEEEILNKEYDALMDEREKLDAEKGKAVTSTEIKAYNKKVVDFNNRIQAYEKKRDQFSDKVKAFNEKIAGESAEADKK